MNTPRPTTHHVPLPTRSTDVRMLRECPGAWTLQLLLEGEVRETVYFELGTIAHSVLEQAINRNLDLDDALALASSMVDGWLQGVDQPIETKARTMDTMQADAARLVSNFYKYVHPSSPDRLEIFDSYQWPPATEQSFMLPATDAGTTYPVWGSADAIFERKPGADVAEHLVIDWKSSLHKIRDNDQLDFYRFGLQLPEADAAFLYLDRSRRSAVLQMADPYVGDRVMRRRIKAAETQKQAILDQQRVYFKPSALCRVCPVQGLCPRRAKGQEQTERLTALRVALRDAQPLEAIPA